MRALETAAGIFGVPGPAAENGEDMSMDAGPAVLMEAQTEERSARVAHDRLYVPPGVSFVAHELCRERLGPSHCDQRRPRRQAAVCFPGVDFSLIEADEDQLWAPGNVEAEAQVVQRGMRFLQVRWLGRMGIVTWCLSFLIVPQSIVVPCSCVHDVSSKSLISVAGGPARDKHRHRDAFRVSLVHADLLWERVCPAGP